MSDQEEVDKIDDERGFEWLRFHIFLHTSIYCNEVFDVSSSKLPLDPPAVPKIELDLLPYLL